MRLWWWARLDSNQEPTDYEPDALTIELRARALTISEAETHCTMPAANLSLPTANFSLPTAGGLVAFAHCTMPAANFSLPTADFSLPTVDGLAAFT